MTLIVHASLSAIGFVAGGPVAVVLALEQVLGPGGTLAMPTHTPELTDPSLWDDPVVPEAWWPAIRAHMVPFDPHMTPARSMGAVADTFRTQAGAVRSEHPFTSWAARGPKAGRIAADHELPMSQGEGSPLARLYEADAHVLLLGVGYDVNTSFHLAEYRCRFAPRKRCRRAGPLPAPPGQGGEGGARWVEYDDIYWYEADFDRIGEAFEREHRAVLEGRVGQAGAKLFSQVRAVDFAVRWMDENRDSGG
jgi:aminoglycoside 3-N-acetyltransferase